MLHRGTASAVILTLSLLLAACGGSAEDESRGDASPDAPASAPAASAAPQPTPTPAESASGDAASASDDSAEMAERLRERTQQMWDAYNSYSMDALKAFYEESYWAEEEAELERNMAPFKERGVTFTAEETSPPTEVAPGKWQIKQTARFDGGSVRMVFVYEQFDDDWLLTYAETE